MALTFLEAVRLGPSCWSIDQLINKAFSNGIDVPESSSPWCQLLDEPLAVRTISSFFLTVQPRGEGSWSTRTTRLVFSNLGEYWTAAKPPSERIARHSVGFFILRRVLDYS